ncbi:MAG: hypothetical protein COW56_09650 [Rhodocyclales bacterium CG17_big_fil_post_rev_8_21_14_2_50_68_7]|nr:MAG: hypothetical protein COW56_09650 [Rhodocyclales bacterium CG17_big_fil_post_rev_8_21_14_2_50_68_7]
MKHGIAFVLLFGGLVGLARAGATLADQNQLRDALIAGEPCCVIDARSAANRKSRPLPGALLWRADLKIRPTAAAVIVGDRDADSLTIANTLARWHPGKTIIAVKGGLATWQAASAAAANAGAVPGGSAQSFVIPRNTCESGTTLQELRSGPTR